MTHWAYTTWRHRLTFHQQALTSILIQLTSDVITMWPFIIMASVHCKTVYSRYIIKFMRITQHVDLQEKPFVFQVNRTEPKPPKDQCMEEKNLFSVHVSQLYHMRYVMHLTSEKYNLRLIMLIIIMVTSRVH